MGRSMGHSREYRARQSGPEWSRLERLAARSGLSSLEGGPTDNGVGARMRRLYDDPGRPMLKLEFKVEDVFVALMERPPQLIVGDITEARTVVLAPIGPVVGASVNGAPLEENSILVACRGSSFHVLETHDWLAAGVSFPESLWRRQWPDCGSVAGVFRVDPKHAAGIRSTIWRNAEIWSEAPGRFEDKHFAREQRDEIYRCFATALTDGNCQRVEPSAPIKGYYELTRRIDAFLDAHQAEKIVVEDVAAALSVSPRTIHNAMLAISGRSLYRYLRERRLWSARAMLMKQEGLIKQVALANGFAHFGRFTQQYTEMFGEQPSATRKRSRREGNTAFARPEAAPTDPSS